MRKWTQKKVKEEEPDEVRATVIEHREVFDLSPETREALERFDADIQALTTMVEEIMVTHAEVLTLLHGEVEERAGIEVFAPEIVNGPVEHADEVLGDITAAPSIMNPRRSKGTIPEADRIRETPFTRAPRSVQCKWLREEVLHDGGWHTAIGIARAVANDERHFRYLRHAVGGRLREMHEDGEVERRDSNVRGSMFEYRLKKP